MAKTNEGWLRKKHYTDGLTWLFCFQTTRALDGKRVEHSKRVGLASQFPSEKSAWREVERLGLSRLLDNSVGSEPTFNQLVDHYKLHELERVRGVAVKARETAARDKHNLDGHVLPRWGSKIATAIKPLELEAWFVAMSEGLQWPTVSKIRSAMSQVFNHAMRHNLIPADHPNPVKLARCKTTSAYEAKVVTPEQMIAILEILDTPTTRLEWMAALLCSATALRPEELFGLQWSDVAWEKNQINVRRAWSKGKQTDGKTEGSMTQVPLHPDLAVYLQQWRRETLHSKDTDWVFASVKAKGKIPRAASTCGKDYLRPAAVTAGVLDKDDHHRFGWHNLRHSLATFLAANDVNLKTAQTILRHKKLSTTADIYTHAVQSNQLAASGQYLEAIKMGSQSVN